MGLHDAQQIGGMAIDPADENKVFVTALGHHYGPDTEKEIYRTAAVKAGKSFFTYMRTRMLYR